MSPSTEAAGTATGTIDLTVPPRRERLNGALLDAFRVRDELERLVRFNLPYRLDHIVGDAAGNESAVFRLVEEAEQNGELLPLLRGAVRANPGNALLAAFCREFAPAALARPDPAELVGPVVGGLTALADALADPDVAAWAGEFRSTFRAVERQSRTLAVYKRLHDELHNLQMRLGPIEDAAGALAAPVPPPRAGVLLAREVVNLRNQAGRARAAAAGLEHNRAAETDWCDQMEEAAADIDAAVRARDGGGAVRATAAVRRLLQEAYRIEGLIAAAAAEMRLGDLIDALAGIDGRWTDAGAAARGRVRAGRDALAALRPELAGMLVEHGEWQFLSKELAGIDVGRGHRPADKVPRWKKVRARLEGLWQSFQTEPWAAELKLQVSRWERAAEEDRVLECEEAAVQVRATEMNRFFEADLELLHLCARLAEIGVPLRTLLGD